MTKYPTPTEEGHYWAKLKLAEEPDNNSVDWEVVQVHDNIMRPWCEADIETGECMMVMVPGIERGQLIDAFVWGPAVIKPKELASK